MKDAKQIGKSLHPYEWKTLPIIDENTDFKKLVELSGLKQVAVMRAIQWLSNKGLIKIDEKEIEQVELGENGKKYRSQGLPERLFLSSVSSKEKDMGTIAKETSLDKDELNVCIGLLKRKAAIEIKKEGTLKISINDQGKKLLDGKTLEEKFIEKEFPLSITDLKPEERFAFDSLKSRRDILAIAKTKKISVSITSNGKKVKESSGKYSDMIDKLTVNIIKSGDWQKKQFREYDVSINVPQISGGKKHFLTQATEYIRRIWLDLGFKEMDGNIVQTSFWDLDSLFVPQDHPARQMQDTFFLADPAKGKLPAIHKKVKEVHENGGDTGSKGWGGKWSANIAEDNLLRTHTTVLSAQTISKLKKEDLPAKFFAVGKVFRNEALDYKHLFEFEQVEGIVVDPKANFTHLKGYLREFFTKMGFEDVRIRPAYFPYTEISAEVEVLHPIHKEWIELGGSGIFRPEVTKTLMGFEVPVLAWGLGLGRIVKEYWSIKDIRDLNSNDLKMLKELKYFMR